MTNQTPESVIAEVIEYHADAIDTHGPGCYKNHAACLAVKLRDMLRGSGVPDAATEQAKQELAACLDLRAYWRGQSVKARSERDAALAAIERVRAIHEPIPIYEGAESCGHTDDEHTTFESDQGIVLCENSPLGYSICGGCSDDSSADGPVEHPCPTVAALDEAPEPEALELPETGLEVRDGDGDLITTGEHRRVLHQGGYVCDTCVNILGINVRWDRADRMEGHPLPVEGESK